jgi:hypothetical protein
MQLIKVLAVVASTMAVTTQAGGTNFERIGERGACVNSKGDLYRRYVIVMTPEKYGETGLRHACMDICSKNKECRGINFIAPEVFKTSPDDMLSYPAHCHINVDSGVTLSGIGNNIHSYDAETSGPVIASDNAEWTKDWKCYAEKKDKVKSDEKTKVHTESFCVKSSPHSVPSETEMAQFDTAVRTTGKFVRFCDGCDDSHKTIVYRRLTPLPASQSFGDLVFKTWSSENNRLGENFEMYGSLKDARRQRNEWSFCNYDDENIGFPRDCGKKEAVLFQWNAIAQPEGKFTKGEDVRFCTL